MRAGRDKNVTGTVSGQNESQQVPWSQVTKIEKQKVSSGGKTSMAIVGGIVVVAVLGALIVGYGLVTAISHGIAGAAL